MCLNKLASTAPFPNITKIDATIKKLHSESSSKKENDKILAEAAKLDEKFQNIADIERDFAFFDDDGLMKKFDAAAQDAFKNCEEHIGLRGEDYQMALEVYAQSILTAIETERADNPLLSRVKSRVRWHFQAPGGYPPMPIMTMHPVHLVIKSIKMFPLAIDEVGAFI